MLRIDFDTEIPLSEMIFHQKEYETLGYNIEEMKSKVISNKKKNNDVYKWVMIKIPVDHLLSNYSQATVKVQCDYCLKEGKETIYEKTYEEYCRSQKNNASHLDACKEHRYVHQKNNTFLKYGVTSTSLIPEVKQKQLKTLYENWGVDNPLKNKELKNRANKTLFERTGYSNPSQCPEIQEKKIQTNLKHWGQEQYMQSPDFKEKTKEYYNENFGVDHPSQVPEIINRIAETSRITNREHKEEIEEKRQRTSMERIGYTHHLKSPEGMARVKETNLKKYGVPFVSQNEEIKKKIGISRNITLYKTGTGPCSKQQDYLHEILGGELNYPIDNCSLDIAFPSDKIYIEYNGGAHDYAVKIGRVTKEDFRKRELKRFYFLKSKEWKEIIIASDKDFLPEDNIILEMKKFSYQFFIEYPNKNWIKFNIDLNKVFSSKEFEQNYDFGILRKI